MPQETRDEVVAFIAEWTKRTGLSAKHIVEWLALSASTYHDWRRRNGKANQHNSAAPRTFWLLPWERAKIIEWHALLPDDGYRRLCYAMLDANAVAVSPATMYRVLRDADLLRRWQKSASQKGTGFVQPTRAHQHWHIDISYLNIDGTFY